MFHSIFDDQFIAEMQKIGQSWAKMKWNCVYLKNSNWHLESVSFLTQYKTSVSKINIQVHVDDSNCSPGPGRNIRSADESSDSVSLQNARIYGLGGTDEESLTQKVCLCTESHLVRQIWRSLVCISPVSSLVSISFIKKHVRVLSPRLNIVDKIL